MEDLRVRGVCCISERLPVFPGRPIPMREREIFDVRKHRA